MPAGRKGMASWSMYTPRWFVGHASGAVLVKKCLIARAGTNFHAFPKGRWKASTRNIRWDSGFGTMLRHFREKISAVSARTTGRSSTKSRSCFSFGSHGKYDYPVCTYRRVSDPYPRDHSGGTIANP